VSAIDYCPPGAEYPACKYPEWITLLGTKSARGQINLMPAGWALEISADPPLFGISVGFERYSYELMEQSDAFSWIAAADGWGPDIYFCGTHSGRDVEKTKHLQCMKIKPGKSLDVPLLERALRNVECRRIGALVTGDHKMYVGQAVRDEYDPGRRRLLNFNNRLYAPAVPQKASIHRCGGAGEPTSDPRWINIVTAADTDGDAVETDVPLSITSHEPQMVCIALKQGGRLERCIRDSGYFAFHWPTAEMASAVEALRRLDSEKGEKFAPAGLKRIDGKAGPAPLIAGSMCSVECKVAGLLELPGTVLISGTVLETHRFAPGLRLLDFGNGVFAPANVDLTRAWQGPLDD